jgi:hypothetical protein
VSVFAFAQLSTLGRSIVLDALLKKKAAACACRAMEPWHRAGGELGRSPRGRNRPARFGEEYLVMADADLRRRQEASKAEEKGARSRKDL